MPNLLKHQNGQWVAYKENCYFLIGDIKGDIPPWVKIPSFAKDYQDELFAIANTHEEILKIKMNDRETHISRLIHQNNIYRLVNFSYRDKNNIITTVNSSVDTYEKAIDFVKWLWRNYGKESDWMPPKNSETSSGKYNFPNANEKTIQKSEKLYFGNNYGNDLSEKLFDNTYGKFPSSRIFISESDEIVIFIDFISKFGVKKFPAIETREIVPLDAYSSIYEEKIRANPNLSSCEWFEVKYNLPFISNLENILKTLTTDEIIRWVKEDFRLKSYLSGRLYYEKSKIEYIGNRQQYYRSYGEEIINYLLFFFNNTKWIEINENKYAPNEILNDINSKNNIQFSELVPVVTIDFIENLAKSIGIKYAEIENILGLFALCERVTDLSSNDFYGLMMKLPEYDFPKSVKLSNSIYHIIEQPNFSKTFDDSENKQRFFNEGKVLVELLGKLEYYKASESYLPSSKIVVKKNVPIIKKRQRTNNANFNKIFGCQEYDQDYTVLKDSIEISNANADFQKYYKEFLRFALAYSRDNKNIETTASKVKITLVKSISLSENNKTENIDEDYTTIRESTTEWYITVSIDNFYDSDILCLSVQIENIYSNIANTPGFDEGKIGELFRTNDKSTREFLIKKEFDTLDVIGDDFYKNQVQNNFMEAVKKIDPQYEVEKIDIDFNDFSNMSNCEKIIALLVSLESDIEDFVKAGFVYSIDLVPYFERELKTYIGEEKEKIKYTNFLFTNAIKDMAQQKDFLKRIDEFDNFKDNVKIENSVHYNVKKIVDMKFGDWRNFSNQEDARGTYTKNYKEMNPDNLFSDELANNEQVQTMIYFNKSEDFKAWIISQQQEQEVEHSEKTNDTYTELRNVIPTKQEIKFQEDNQPKISKNRNPKGSYTFTDDAIKGKAMKIFGNKGELVIYNLLCKEHGKENVTARSEAFVDLGIIVSGLATSGQYDISYKDKEGKEFFVEVKTGDGKSFIT